MANKKQDIAPLFGLVLMGGKSHRMGTHKAELVYHEQAQYLHLHNLLAPLCIKTYFSVNDSFSIDKIEKSKVIVDGGAYAGPYNGLMSAHKAYPKVAWLVVACDLPFLGENELKTLIKFRNPDKPATALCSKTTGAPEPLVCIWEPHGLESAKAYMTDSGNISPKHFLIHSDAERVFVENEACLFNANTQEDFEFAKRKIDNSQQKE